MLHIQSQKHELNINQDTDLLGDSYPPIISKLEHL